MTIRKPFVKQIENQYARQGQYFFAGSYSASVAIVSPFSVLIKAPNTSIRCHLVAHVSVSAASSLSVISGPTVSGAGTSVTAYNADRNSSTAATAVVTHTPTTSGGTTIATYQLGANVDNAFGSLNDTGMRLILAQNTYYEFKVTTQADGTKVSINLEWYEV